MEKTRKVFIGWGLEPMEDSGVINCGEYDSVEEATKAVADAGLMLAEIESEYEELSDITNEWPGRNTAQGQAKLCRLRDLISKATGREAEEVQDDYCSRVIAKKGI